MPPTQPPLDEHGFPIPPTFDGPGVRRRPGYALGRAWQIGLVLAFVGLVAGSLYKSVLSDGVKQWVAGELVARANQKYRFGDVPGALADLERAVSWSPDDPRIYAMRAQFKLEMNDVDGSLKDFDQLIRLAPRHAQAYVGRSVVYQRLERHREAIDDLTKAISLSPSREAMPRNNRAYARALANVDLDAALVDVEQALRIVEHEIAEAELSAHDPETVRRYIAQVNSQKAAYLDTRGYIFFLQDKYDLALEDLDKAIELTVEWQTMTAPELQAAQRAVAEARQRQFDHELAVMYHHRGQVLEKLGRQDEGKSDLDRGDQLGYNPAAGVF